MTRKISRTPAPLIPRDLLVGIVAFLAVFVLTVVLTGCLAKVLRVPVEDHFVQSHSIAEDCRQLGWGNGKCTQEDLDAMRDQAQLLDDIIKKRKPTPPADTGTGTGDDTATEAEGADTSD